MNKVNNEPMARKLAVENGECYGMSVFGGDWYTGTREQLERAGVAEIVDPQCVKGSANARLIAAAPEMAELLERLAANCAADRYVERLTCARDARTLLTKIKGPTHA